MRTRIWLGSSGAVLFVHGGPGSPGQTGVQPSGPGPHGGFYLLLVLVPNVRGSTGYGKRWYSADDVRKRLDSVADLAALHAYLPSLGLDPDPRGPVGRVPTAALHRCWLGWRVPARAVGGRRRHRGDRVAGDVPGEHLGLPPRLPRARVRHAGSRPRVPAPRASPADQPEIDQVRAPLFVIHGANDPRVPLGARRSRSTPP